MKRLWSLFTVKKIKFFFSFLPRFSSKNDLGNAGHVNPSFELTAYVLFLFFSTGNLVKGTYIQAPHPPPWIIIIIITTTV